MGTQVAGCRNDPIKQGVHQEPARVSLQNRLIRNSCKHVIGVVADDVQQQHSEVLGVLVSMSGF